MYICTGIVLNWICYIQARSVPRLRVRFWNRVWIYNQNFISLYLSLFHKNENIHFLSIDNIAQNMYFFRFSQRGSREVHKSKKELKSNYLLMSTNKWKCIIIIIINTNLPKGRSIMRAPLIKYSLFLPLLFHYHHSLFKYFYEFCFLDFWFHASWSYVLSFSSLYLIFSRE